MLKENRNVLYNSIRKFLIFTAFFLTFFFYQRTIVFDRLYVLVIAQSAALIIYIISIFRIRIGFYIFIFLVPLLSTFSNMYGIRHMNVVFFLFLVLFLGFLVNRFKSNNEFIYETELTRPVFIYLIILTLSTAITIFRYSNFYPFITTKFHNLTVNFAGYDSMGSIFWTLKYFFNYISGFALLFIIFNIIKSRKDFIISIIILLSTYPIVIAMGFYQHFLNPYFGNITFWIEAGRVNSTFTDPNALGGYIILLFPLIISLIIFFRKWYLKLIVGLFLALFIYLSFLCGSRSAFVAIFIAAALYAIIGLSIALRYFIKRKIKKPNKSVFISVGTVILLLLIVSSLFLGILLKSGILDNADDFKGTGIILVDRMIETAGDFYTSLKTKGFVNAYRDISSGRDILWRQAFYMFRDHPVSGVGQAAYFIELSDYHRRYHRGFHILDFTGNYYLQILSELGFVGIILVLFIFFLITKKSIKYLLNKNKNKNLEKYDWLFAGLFISFFCMLVVFSFGPHTNFIEVQLLFWLVIGLMLAYIGINSRDKMPPETIKQNSVGRLEGTEIDSGLGGNWLSGNSSKYFHVGNFRQVKFDMISKIALIFIIIVFGFTLLKSSATDLSINIKQTLYKWENYYGFYSEEVIEGKKVRWTSIDAIEVLQKEGEKLIIPVKDSDPAGHLLPLFIRFYINNTLAKIVKINDKDWHNIEIDLSNYHGERFTLTMACSRSWVPKERGLSNDTRELGVITGEFRFLK